MNMALALAASNTGENRDCTRSRRRDDHNEGTDGFDPSAGAARSSGPGRTENARPIQVSWRTQEIKPRADGTKLLAC
ncbi:hypothetical protein X777_01397 [Ooceraea biroi]|uniref:Uncharacterized protein n=1 Tax=Ooceraea biroi TaxID=2015173 RepID=A0A026WQS0_OOCBI|nr:hypothetical protein X777_01397 [Ooceraea biroi]